MRRLLAPLFLFLFPLIVLAARFSWDEQYEDQDDLSELFISATPVSGFDDSFLQIDIGISPVNRTVDQGLFKYLYKRAVAGCGRCDEQTCCNNGTYCCRSGLFCTSETWCCPRGQVPCPQAAGVCTTDGETCCGSGACTAGTQCCGSTCCPNTSTCNDGICESPPSSTSTSTTSTTPTPPPVSTTPPPVSSSSSPPPSSSSSSSSPDPPPSSSTPDPPSSSSSSNPPPTSTQPNPPPVSSNPPPPPPPPPSSSSPDPPPSSTQPDPPPPSSTQLDPPPSSSQDPPTQTNLDIPAQTNAAVPSSDPPPQSSGTSVDTPPSQVSQPQNPSPTSTTDPADPPPSSVISNPPQQTSVAPPDDNNSIVPFIATANVGQSTQADQTQAAVTVPGTTLVSNGATLTVAPHVATATANQNLATTTDAEEDASDAIAYVAPWDPRITYSPPGAWQSTDSQGIGQSGSGSSSSSSSGSSTGGGSGTTTSSSSAVGSCHNGTVIGNEVGAQITFPFEGKEIALLLCPSSKGGDVTVQIDGNPASTVSGYKDPSLGADECILSQPFTSSVMPDAPHSIVVTIKGSPAGSATNGTNVEFGGFIYRGIHASGTTSNSKSNIGAIVGGTVGGVVGGIAIIAFIVIIVIIRRRRRNARIDGSSAIHQTPAPAPSATPYSAVPTTEYHDPYANAGLGPQFYPSPAVHSDAGGSGGEYYSGPQPRWAQTNQGPFGSGSFAAAPSHRPAYGI